MFRIKALFFFHYKVKTVSCRFHESYATLLVLYYLEQGKERDANYHYEVTDLSVLNKPLVLNFSFYIAAKMGIYQKVLSIV